MFLVIYWCSTLNPPCVSNQYGYYTRHSRMHHLQRGLPQGHVRHVRGRHLAHDVAAFLRVIGGGRTRNMFLNDVICVSRGTGRYHGR